MPVKELVKQTVPAPPAPVREVAEGLVYRDFLTVGLLLRKLHVQVKGSKPATSVEDNWIYVQDGGVQVGRIQVFNNWSPYMVADRKNTVWIGLEYFVNEGEKLWNMADADLIELGTQGARAHRVHQARGRPRRVRAPDAEGVSRLLRHLRPAGRRARVGVQRCRTCSSSGATACTATTIRTTACSPR